MQCLLIRKQKHNKISVAYHRDAPSNVNAERGHLTMNHSEKQTDMRVGSLSGFHPKLLNCFCLMICITSLKSNKVYLKSHT